MSVSKQFYILGIRRPLKLAKIVSDSLFEPKSAISPHFDNKIFCDRFIDHKITKSEFSAKNWKIQKNKYKVENLNFLKIARIALIAYFGQQIGHPKNILKWKFWRSSFRPKTRKMKKIRAKNWKNPKINKYKVENLNFLKIARIALIAYFGQQIGHPKNILKWKFWRSSFRPKTRKMKNIICSNGE